MSSEVTMRQSYDLGIVRWMFDDGILLRSELRLKLNVEVDGDVEWIRTEVVTPPGRVGSTPKTQVRGHEIKKQTSKDLEIELLRAREEHTLVPGKLKSTTRRGAKLFEE